MSSYFQHKMQYARRRKSLRTINEQYGIKSEANAFLDMMNPDEDITPPSNFYANFYRYDSVEDIKSRLNSGSALCGFFSRDSNEYVFVAYGNSCNQFDFVRVEIDRFCQGTSCCGLNYLPMKIDTRIFEPLQKKEFDEMCDGYCLILPYFEIAETVIFSKKYALVTDGWEILSEEDSVLLSYAPHICEELFERLLESE